MNFRAQDMITLGIFSVIILVITIVINMPSVLSPFLIPFMKSLSGMIAAIPFMLYLTRVRYFGLITLLALILAVIMVLVGDYVLILATAMIAGGLADFMCSLARKVNSRILMILGYAIFNLWSVGALLPLLFMRQTVVEQVTKQLGVNYAQTFSSLFTFPVVYLTIAGIFVTGLAGAVIGLHLLDKHFVRAGLVAKN